MLRSVARVREIDTLPTWCYSVEDEAGNLLYVGITCDLLSRLKQHRAGKPWWGQSAYVIANLYADRELALKVEARALCHRRPPHNREVPPEPVWPVGFDANEDAVMAVDLETRHLS